MKRTNEREKEKEEETKLEKNWISCVCIRIETQKKTLSMFLANRERCFGVCKHVYIKNGQKHARYMLLV